MSKPSRMYLWPKKKRTQDTPEEKVSEPEPQAPEPEAEPEPPPVEAGEWRGTPQEEEREERDQSFRGKRLPHAKSRRTALSVCCSKEEAALLRKAAKESGKGFSSWARVKLFAAMGQLPPERQDPG